MDEEKDREQMAVAKDFKWEEMDQEKKRCKGERERMGMDGPMT